MRWLGWAFVLFAVGSVVTAFYLPARIQTLSQISIVFAAAGVLLSLAGHLFGNAKEADERKDKRSQFYLDASVKALEEANTLLADGNNSRRLWVAAGRALKFADELAALVTEEHHLKILELNRIKYRRTLSGFLNRDSRFFYGVDAGELSLDEVAAKSSAKENRFGNDVISTVNRIDEADLRTVWKASQWPESYKQPLRECFVPDEKAQISMFYPGLSEFLEHAEENVSTFGKLHRRSQS